LSGFSSRGSLRWNRLQPRFVATPSHDPTPEFLQPFLEPPLLGPIALGHRIGEGERQRVAVVGGSEPSPPHVVLALEQDGVAAVVAVLDGRQVGGEVAVVGQAAGLAPFLEEAPYLGGVTSESPNKLPVHSAIYSKPNRNN
jgi:hypothetical protein